jgi:hypothetical protein
VKLISLSARALVTAGSVGAVAVGALVSPLGWGSASHGWTPTSSTTSTVGTTLPASSVSSTGATLNAAVSTRSHAKGAYFQWGTSSTYGSSTPMQSLPKSGSTSVDISSAVTTLKSGTTYHFRVVVPTNRGTVYGKDASFQTAGAPTTTSPTATSSPTSSTSTTSTSTTSTSSTSSTTSSPTSSTTTTSSPTSSTTTTSSGACTPQWTSSAPYGSWSTNGYLVNNNMWSGDAGPQTISACAWNRWSITSNQPGTGTDDSVKTYADTQKHVNLPLSSLTSLPSSFDVTTPAGGGTVPTKGKQWNAAYDLWLDNYGTEVMVWNNWTMNWQYWYGVNKGVQLTVDGVAYHAYTNGSGIWFVRDNVTNKGTVDLAHLLQWAVGKGWLKSSQTLGEVEYGFEVSYTGTPTTFTLNNLSVGTP